MTCQYEPLIGGYLERDLDAGDAAAFEAHLPRCAGCTAAVADLRAIQATARLLERRLPPPGVWHRIEAAAEAEGAPVAHDNPVSRSWNWRPFAAAAAVVLMLGGAAWLVLSRQAEAPVTGSAAVTDAPGNATEPDVVQSVEMQMQLAEEEYAQTIQGLEAIASVEVSTLDPETADVVQANLTLIDEAIGESQAVLEEEPTNTVAQESLFGALQSKVSLLQDTIALINEMRKGDPEGAARVVSEMTP